MLCSLVLTRHSSKAFTQAGHSIWSLNSKIASEVETDIYERLLNREKQRKRKRRSARGLSSCFRDMIIRYAEHSELHMHSRTNGVMPDTRSPR